MLLPMTSQVISDLLKLLIIVKNKQMKKKKKKNDLVFEYCTLYTYISYR